MTVVVDGANEEQAHGLETMPVFHMLEHEFHRIEHPTAEYWQCERCWYAVLTEAWWMAATIPVCPGRHPHGPLYLWPPAA